MGLYVDTHVFLYSLPTWLAFTTHTQHRAWELSPLGLPVPPRAMPYPPAFQRRSHTTRYGPIPPPAPSTAEGTGAAGSCGRQGAPRPAALTAGAGQGRAGQGSAARPHRRTQPWQGGGGPAPAPPGGLPARRPPRTAAWAGASPPRGGGGGGGPGRPGCRGGGRGRGSEPSRRGGGGARRGGRGRRG